MPNLSSLDKYIVSLCESDDVHPITNQEIQEIIRGLDPITQPETLEDDYDFWMGLYIDDYWENE